MIMRRGLILMEEFIRDLLVTEYASSVPQRKVFRAIVLSGMITMANVVLITVALQDSVSGGVANIMAFAGGSSLGTFSALKKFQSEMDPAEK